MFCVFTDFKFAIYPPSMIAAASVSAAATGLLGPAWISKFNLLHRLQKITTIDVVSISIDEHLCNNLLN